MSSPFTVGPKGDKPRSDLRVTFSKNSSPLKVSIQSKVESLYGDSIKESVLQTCDELEVSTGLLEIDDYGALPFVISARVEAAIKKAYPNNKNVALPELKSFCTHTSSRFRFRRSRLYLPGNQPKLMLNAGIHKPDGLILDLEDAVSPLEKDDTQYLVRNVLRSLDFMGAERMVRINQGEQGLQDLEFVIPHNVHLILIPKVESADQVKQVDTKIHEIAQRWGRKDPVYLMPILESGRGILKALEIAEASENTVALAIGLEDYTADIGVQRTLDGRESFFARSMLINAARAAGIQAIDTVFSDVSDEEGLRTSVREAKMLGFDGKGCIHPRQIKPIHEEFAPTDTEVEKAQKIVTAFQEAEAKGLGVVALGNKMIDPPVVKRALRILDLNNSK